jgi:hypothetical protein
MSAVRGGIYHRKPILIDPHGNRARVDVEVVLHQRDIAKCCCEQHVGSGPLCDEEFRDLGAIADEVLRWSRVVIIVERINLGAMFEEKSGDLYRPGEMQRPFAVAAFGMDEGWIACDQGGEFPHHAKIGGRPDVDLGAAGNEGSSLIRVHLIKHAETALLPTGPGI